MGISKRKLKSLFIVFVILTAIVFSFSALFPSEVMTSKWVVIAGKKEKVNSTLSDLKSWQSWNDLLVGNSEINILKNVSLTLAGDQITWKSGNGNLNKITISDANENGMAMDIELLGELPVQSAFSVTQRNDSVHVVWSIVEKLRWYPWEKIYGMMASDMKGPAMQHSLDMFKEQVYK